MAPIGLAFLGAGIFAKEAHLPALSILGSNSIELKAVYSRSKSSASSLAEVSKERLGLDGTPSIYSEDGAAEGNLDALLERSDIQAVIVLLPLTQQPEIVLRALAAGKNVLSEKPVAKDVKTGLALIEKWEKEYKPTGLIWRVAENFEVEPGLVEAARKIKAGAIGTVWSFNFSMIWTISQDNKYYNTSWRTIPDYQGGFLLDAGVHATATLRLILPFSLGTSTVTGFSSLTREHLKPHDTIQAVIQAQKTPDTYPPQGIFELSCAAPPGFGHYLYTITGTEGNMTITMVQKPASEADSAIAKAAAAARQSADEENLTLPHFRVTITSGRDGKNVEEFDMIGCGVLKEIESFANAIAGQDDGNGDPRGALQDVALIQAFLDSNGRPVDIKQLLEKGSA